MFAGATSSKARTAFVTLTWIVSCSFSLAAQTRLADTKPEPITGPITGRVLNDAGQGVPNAMVYARAALAISQRATATDNEGNFRFEGLDSALYGLVVAAPSYVTPPRDPEAEPVYYRLSDSVTLNIIKGGVITGTVLSASGEPVVQVGVRAILVRDANGQTPRYAGFQSQRATDDRGVYRIYGLLPGTYVVFAGGRSSFGGINAYVEEAPTYAPSSTRDTAALISVNSGDETTVDIKYRGDPGYAVSGTLNGMPEAGVAANANVFLTQVVNGASMAVAVSYAPAGTNSFSFYGVADGEYDLKAQLFSAGSDSSMSETRHIVVKGSAVTGIELNIRPLASISGRVVLAKSDAAECKDKRQPLFSETLINARRSEKEKSRDRPPFITFVSSPGVPGQAGDFRIRNLAPGQYSLQTRYFAKYWYVKSIVQQSSATVPIPAKTLAANTQNDLARNGVAVKFGENVSRVTVNLAEGAASLRGSLKLQAGQHVPAGFYLYLLPAEKESTDDVLRFFTSEVGADGAFAFNNLPPGRYWALGQVAPNNETQSDFKLRLPEETETRSRLRREAEAGKVIVELKPCQNAIDYQMALSLPLPKN